MEEIIDYIMKTPENTNGNILREKLQKMGGSGGGVLMVTDTDGTLDKTMGEIQDAYLAGKRVIILTMDGGVARDVIGIIPISRGKRTYNGTVETYHLGSVNSELVIMSWTYDIYGEETEEAARNAYPENRDK